MEKKYITLKLYMRKLYKGLALSEQRESKGFTLIELLIVIALLGALAVGLLAALDPFEQLKKGTDTATRSKVSELHGAVIRYYGIKSNMPWCPTGAGCPADPSATNLVTAPMVDSLTEIINAGELKSNFLVLAGGDATKIFTTGSQALATISVCYKPTAKSFIKDPNTKFTQSGVGTCATNDPTQLTCYWCVE